MRWLMAAIVVGLAPLGAGANAQNAQVLPGGCGTAALGSGTAQLTMDSAGNLCSSASLSGNVSTTATASATPTAVLAGAGKSLNISLNSGLFTELSLAGTLVSTAAPLPVGTTAGNLTVTSLDVSSVTTGGTAVSALSAAHRTKGGWLQNPTGATVALCINEKGTASGTSSSGDTTCIAPGQTYLLAPNGGAVSVVSSDSSHSFSGYGFN